MDRFKDIFAGISEYLLEEIKIHSRIKAYKAGEVLFNEGDYIKNFLVVLSGSIKLIKENEEGKEIYLYSIYPGESCLMSFFNTLSNENSKVRAVAEEKSEVLLIPSDLATKWIDEYPSWNKFIIQLYNKRFEELLETINAIAFQKMDQRILKALRRRYKASGNSEIHITHQQLADELGTHREVVSRLLKQLEKEKKVVLYRNKIRIIGLK